MRKEEGHVLRRALDFEVEDQRKRMRRKRKWKKQIEVESVKVDMSPEDAFCRLKCIVGINPILLALIRLILG